LKVLEQRIDSRLNLEHHLTALRNKPWLRGLPSDYKKESLQGWFNAQKLAIRAKNFFQSLREIKDCVNPAAYSKTEFHSLFRQLLDALKDIPAKKEEWANCLSSYHIRQVIIDTNFAQRLKDTCEEISIICVRTTH
jgi:hypothetical protein